MPPNDYKDKELTKSRQSAMKMNEVQTSGNVAVRRIWIWFKLLEPRGGGIETLKS